jgi:hypothetical protein
MVIVSLLTSPPPAYKVEGNVITKAFFIDEKKSYQNVRFYNDFRVWAVTLFVLCFVMIYIYW